MPKRFSANSTESALPQLIAERLLQDIGKFIPQGAVPPHRFPSRAHLCRHYGVSQRTMTKVLHLLEKAGHLELRPRSRPVVTSSLETGTLPATNSGAKLAEALAEAIHQGVYLRGAPLPKVSYLSRQYHCSQHTVLQAFSRLAARSLVHKQGRQWRAGAPATPLITLSTSRSSIICVLQPTPHFWRSMDNPWTGGFVRSFTREIEGNGTLPVSFVLGSNQTSTSVADLILHDLLAKASEWEPRCLGYLMVGPPNRHAQFMKAAAALLDRGARIAWFDSGGHTLVTPPGWSRFLRLQFQEEAFVATALEHLLSAGHRKIGFVGEPTEAWHLNRLEQLKESASRWGHGVTVTGYHWTLQSVTDSVQGPEVIEHWRSRGPEYRRKALTWVNRQTGDLESITGIGPTEPDTRLAELIRRLPAFWPACRLRDARPLLIHLLYGKASALIFPRDQAASRHLDILREMDIHYPEEISLISYDHIWDRLSFPLSTVDNGGERLGYLAVHALCRDLPRPGPEGGTLRAKPFVVDRGTVAPVSR